MFLLCGCSNPQRTEERTSNFTVQAISPGHSLPGQLQPFRRSRPLLGTFVTITAFATDGQKANHAIDVAFGEFERADSLMSNHRPDSELSMLNARAAQEPVRISTELFQVLHQAQTISTLTEGAFDVTIGPLTQLWGFIWKEYRLPTRAELERVLPWVDYRNLQLLPNGLVRFTRPGMFLDLGGIGKGVAVDMAVAALKANGIPAAMVKAGGDLRVYGTPPGQMGWIVQLEDPAKEGKRITIPMEEGALSTSGNYENFFIVDNKVYSHIISPKSGLPVEGIASCTVIAQTCTESDAWATALTIYGVEKSLKQFGNTFPMRFSLMPQNKGRDFKIRASSSFPKPLEAE